MVLAISRRATLVLVLAVAVGLAVWVLQGEREGAGSSAARDRAGDEEAGDDEASSGAQGKLPPSPGQDPSYEGPSPREPWREGQFAQKAGPSMPRPPPPEVETGATLDAVERAVARAPGSIAFLSSMPPEEPWMAKLGPRIVPLSPEEVDGEGTELDRLAHRL